MRPARSEEVQDTHRRNAFLCAPHGYITPLTTTGDTLPLCKNIAKSGNIRTIINWIYDKIREAFYPTPPGYPAVARLARRVTPESGNALDTHTRPRVRLDGERGHKKTLSTCTRPRVRSGGGIAGIPGGTSAIHI